MGDQLVDFFRIRNLDRPASHDELNRLDHPPVLRRPRS